VRVEDEIFDGKIYGLFIPLLHLSNCLLLFTVGGKFISVPEWWKRDIFVLI
jgi:hypothetical protein